VHEKETGIVQNLAVVEVISHFVLLATFVALRHQREWVVKEARETVLVAEEADLVVGVAHERNEMEIGTVQNQLVAEVTLPLELLVTFVEPMPQRVLEEQVVVDLEVAAEEEDFVVIVAVEAEALVEEEVVVFVEEEDQVVQIKNLEALMHLLQFKTRKLVSTNDLLFNKEKRVYTLLRMLHQSSSTHFFPFLFVEFIIMMCTSTTTQVCLSVLSSASAMCSFVFLKMLLHIYLLTERSSWLMGRKSKSGFKVY